MADKRNNNEDTETLALDAEKQKEFEQKVGKIKPKDKNEELTPGVIYLGHIPHGFYESQIRNFFQQFGSVNRVRLSRSKKTARSKGYAFVEFDCDEVAKIAAETMDNYLMFGRVLKCKVVAPDKIHPRLWQGSNRKFRKVPRRDNEIKRQNKDKSQEEHEKNVGNLLKKQSKKRKNLEKLGITYDFPGYKADAKDSQPKHKRFKSP